MILYDDVTRDRNHMVAGLIGVLAGVAIGTYRAKILYVRAVPEYKSVILTRSTKEYIAIVLLVVVRVFAEYWKIDLGALTLIITALLALIVSEAIVRSGMTLWKYRKEVAHVGSQQ